MNRQAPADLVRYDGEDVEVLAPTTYAGEVDIQVATARRYPRSLTDFRRDLLTEATIDAETAGSMFYTIKRGGKKIEGPSARFAEAALSAWGNLRVSGDIESEDADFVYASATAWDLERNVAIRVRTRRRIRDSGGERYGIDMIGTTGAAATSIAIRNAGLKVIPRSAWWPAYLAARGASLGRGTIAEKRGHALAWFERAGATPADVYRYLEVAGADDIGEEELIALRGLRTAIDDGETTLERALGRERSAETDALNADLERETADTTPPPVPPAAPTPAPAPEPVAPTPAPPATVPPPADPGTAIAGTDRPFIPRADLLRSSSAASGVGVATPKGEPAIEEAAARYRGVLETYRPKWTLRHKRTFEESTIGSAQARWTSVVQYDAAIKAILDAVDAEAEAAEDLDRTDPGEES